MRSSIGFVRGFVATVCLIAVSAAGASTPSQAPGPVTARSDGSSQTAPTVPRRSDELVALAQPIVFRVALPNEDNLQWLSFWVAQGAGYFADEGLDVQVVVPPMPGAAGRFVVRGRAEAAVLPRPQFFNTISRGEPVVAVANLLENDAVNLVLRNEVAEELGISADMPLLERLDAMRGLKVGVAPGPIARLRVLFQSVGLDVDSHLEVVMVDGEAQNQAFGNGEVDGLYAHTPFLETALVEQEGVLLVNQSAGEVPELAGRQIHSLVTSLSNVDAKAQELSALVRAVYRAQRLIHADPKAAAEAVRASGVRLRAPQGLETIVRIYQPAVPETPEVSADRLAREVALLPAHRPAPDLAGIDLNQHVDNSFALEAVRDVR